MGDVVNRNGYVNMLEAKTHLSRLIAEIEEEPESEIVIARHGKPVARLVPFDSTRHSDTAGRIGAARGRYEIPGDIDTPYGDLSDMFAAGKSGTT